MVRSLVIVVLLITASILARRDWTSTASGPVGYEVDGYDKSSNDLNANLIKRFGGKPANWTNLGNKGRSLYREWEQKTGLDNEFPSWMREYFERTIGEADINCGELEFAESLEAAGLDTNEQDYEELSFRWPPRSFMHTERGSATFNCTINARAGVFIAENLDRGNLNGNIHFSEIAWYTWSMQVIAAHPHTEPTELDYSGLKSFWMADASHSETDPILRYIMRERAPGRYPFYPNDAVTDNPFWPLLGSGNGAPIIFLLTENKDAMREKGIRALWVDYPVPEEDTNPIYHLEAEIG